MAKAKKKAADSEAETPAGPVVENYVPRLQEMYKSAVAPELQKRFSYKSAMQVPRLVKVTLNVGLGEATQNPKLLDAAAEEIARMTGQKPVIQKAKKAIANFRLRENQRIGVTVTLRRARSTAAATTRSACASRSSSPRSTTTRSRRSGA